MIGSDGVPGEATDGVVGPGRREALAALRAGNGGRGGTVEIAYWTIRDGIRTKVFGPGERLVEVELAAALDMSRTPVREALRRLESEGLVENAPRRGLSVMTLTLQDLVDIFEIDEVLEGLAARTAAQRMGAAEIEALGQVVGRMEQALAAGDETALATANTQFHAMMRTGSKNGRLPALLGRLHDTAPTLRSHQLATERAPVAIAEHRAIYQAIAARDGDVAERLTREHTQNALRAYVLAHHLAEAG